MPSPIGHSLAGLTVGWLSEPQRPAPAETTFRAAFSPFVLWCAALAALPDADLLIPHAHRTATHSLTATGLILIITAGVTGKVSGRANWRLAFAFAGAHATHLLLDWLGVDRNPPAGIQIFWPFDPRFYISGLDLFPPVSRAGITWQMVTINAYAAVFETIAVGPIALLAWAIRRRRKSRVRSSDRDGRRQPSGGAAGTADISGRPGPRASR
jgi:membrane-bound metal-dependent hydrolase YbcI (DUF457 family)